eukprot:gene21004-23056_t
MEPLVRFKDAEATINTLSKLINLVKELMLLAETHKLEQHLYFGDGLQRICCLLGDARLSRWLTSIGDEDLSPKETWKKFSQFREKEQKLQQQKLQIFNSTTDSNMKFSKSFKESKPIKSQSQRHGPTLSFSVQSCTSSEWTCLYLHWPTW